MWLLGEEEDVGETLAEEVAEEGVCDSGRGGRRCPAMAWFCASSMTASMRFFMSSSFDCTVSWTYRTSQEAEEGVCCDKGW